MPAYLRPCGPFCERAILTGDPARAMSVAQALTGTPQMANHARGLWGYHGEGPDGAPVNVQATGIGAASAVAVLADLAELGVRRALRIGGCRVAEGGPGLGAALRAGGRDGAVIGTVPALPGEPLPGSPDAWDDQTEALLEAAGRLGVELGAVLIVAEGPGGRLSDEDLAHRCAEEARRALDPATGNL